MSHTVGPWASSGVGVVQAETGELISSSIFDSGLEYPNAEANCTLIAAAPDLLAACILFEELTRRGQPAGSEDLELLQTAIAKATHI